MKIIGFVLTFIEVCALSLNAPAQAQPQQAPPIKAGSVYFAAYRTPAHVKRSEAAVFNEVTDTLTEILKSRNVAMIKGPATAMPLSVEELLKQAQAIKASALLYVTVDRPDVSWIKITVQCYDNAGKMLWEEKASDTWSMRGKAGAMKSLKEIETKLEARLGGPGLQLAQAGAESAPPPVQTTNAAPAAAPVPSRLAAGKQAFVVQEHTTKPLATFDVGENARHRAVSPDGNLVAIASDGIVKTHVTVGGDLEHWPDAGSHSSITLIRMPRYEIAGHFDVPFRPHFIRFTADGARLVVVSYGQVSNSANKHIAPQIVLLDAPGGQVRKQVELASEPLAVWFIPEANRLIVPCRGMKKRAEAPPEVVVFDTLNGEMRRVALPSVPFIWHGGDRKDSRYLLTRTGAVIVNVAGELVGKPVEAGEHITFFRHDPHAGRYFLAGRTKDQGRLIVLENGRVVRSLETIPAHNLIIDEKKSRLILCGDKEGVILDPQTLAEQGRLPLPDHMIEARLGPDGNRLYVADEGYHVSVIDLTTRQQVARLSAGRGSAKFLQNVLIPSVMGFAAAGSMAASGTPGIYPSVGFWMPARPPVYCMAFSPNGGFLYVYNPRTNDITMVKTADYTVVKSVALGPIPANSYDALRYRTAPWLSPDGRYLIACELDKVVVIDTEKAEVVTEKKFKASKPSYEPSLDLIFLQEADGTEVLRGASLAFFKDLKPTGDFDFKAKHEGLVKKARGQFEPPEDLVFMPGARRFFLFSPAGVRIFDYELNPVAEVAGISNSGGAYVLP